MKPTYSPLIKFLYIFKTTAQRGYLRYFPISCFSFRYNFANSNFVEGENPTDTVKEQKAAKFQRFMSYEVVKKYIRGQNVVKTIQA
ncbi:hypothetical protein ACM6Q7_21945 [Peribacillus butanolivorans]|uniref:hypothetical protein n=1 Tax=Peribacillus butanolivorans TaxID=421767 RepID=UPI0039FCE1F6